MRALLYDGQSARPQTVTLVTLPDGGLLVSGDGWQRHYEGADIDVGERLPGVPTPLDLPGGVRLEINDGEDFVDALLGGRGGSGIAYWLESRWPAVLAALAAAALLTAWAVRDGAPALARLVVAVTPLSADEAIGAQSLKFIDEYYLEPSALDAGRRAELRAAFDDVVAAAGQGRSYTLLFRGGGGLGANAFAIPGGRVLLTDELVAFAKDDHELVAVLAHEVGHAANRHSMRSLVQNSLVAGLFATLTGDLGSAGALAASLPVALVQAGYSREFERQADAVSMAYLREAGIDPGHLGGLLMRLEAEYGGLPDVLSLLSTHPGAAERARAVRASEMPPGDTPGDTPGDAPE